MCGRYTLSSRAEDIARAFEAELAPAEATDAARAFALPRYNVAPAQPAPVVRATGDGRRLVAAHRFGLVPAWADDPRVGARMINARAETAAEKPAFRAALRQRRCIVPMTGFYEWPRARRGGRARAPTWFHPPERGGAGAALWAAAGLWEEWRGPDGGALATFAILTTSANEVVARVHDRMPVLLDGAGVQRWLDRRIDDARALAPLLAPWPADDTAERRVSPRVNDARAEGPELLLEDAPRPSAQGSLFD